MREWSNTAGIAHEQEFALYHCNGSLCSQKARVGFREKAVPFQSHHIMLCDIDPDCQNLTAGYLADITVMACFHRMEDVGLDGFLRDDSAPRLGDYWDRLRGRPSCSVGITDWHDAGWRSAVEEIRGADPSPVLADARGCLLEIRDAL